VPVLPLVAAGPMATSQASQLHSQLRESVIQILAAQGVRHADASAVETLTDVVKQCVLHLSCGALPSSVLYGL
jgi:hypothetical protein